jgi:enamine deaminase RidA (YjgF/YER057c/UK114 family)
MTRRLISSGSRFEEMAGYSRAVVDGEWIFVSGTTGYDFATGAIAEDAAGQTEKTLENIAAALAQAGAGLADVVRLRVYLADRADIEAVSVVLGRTFAETRPANTTVCCTLTMPEMKVEIEATALKRRNKD